MTGGLNGGVRFDLVYSCFFKFHVPGPMEICQNQKNQSNSMATWPQGVHDIFQNCSSFEPSLFLCPFGNFWKSGVLSYQFYYVQSTTSPILKPLVDWGHLVWGKFPLCYFKATIYLHTNRVFLCRLFLNLVGTYFEHCGFHQKSFLLL